MPRQTKVLYAFFALVSALLFFSEPQATEVTPDSRCSEQALDSVLDGGMLILPESCFIITTETKIIRGDVVIHGEGYGVYISGGLHHQVFKVVEGASLRLENLIIADGKTMNQRGGAGIYNAGQLTLVDTRVTYNQVHQTQGAGVVNAEDSILIMRDSQIHHNTSFGGNGAGLANLGYAVLVDSRIYHNTVEVVQLEDGRTLGMAGGLFNLGVIWITNSQINNNSAPSGGGLVNAGEIILTLSQVRGNQARSTVGCTGSAAGIYNTILGTIVISESAITHNHAGSLGGAVLNQGVTQIVDSQIAHNKSCVFGAGIVSQSAPEFMMQNSIIIQNETTHDFGISREGFIDLSWEQEPPGMINLQNNFWGSDDGPGGMGPGYGDAIHGNYITVEMFTPWLQRPPEWARR